VGGRGGHPIYITYVNSTGINRFEVKSRYHAVPSNSIGNGHRGDDWVEVDVLPIFLCVRFFVDGDDGDLFDGGGFAFCPVYGSQGVLRAFVRKRGCVRA
jgi:hypothetical protein